MAIKPKLLALYQKRAYYIQEELYDIGKLGNLYSQLSLKKIGISSEAVTLPVFCCHTDGTTNNVMVSAVGLYLSCVKCTHLPALLALTDC